MSDFDKPPPPKTRVVKKLNNFQMLQLPKIQLDFTHSRKKTGNFENLQTRGGWLKTPGQNSFLENPEAMGQNMGTKFITITIFVVATFTR